jgi:hypothetical protein
MAVMVGVMVAVGVGVAVMVMVGVGVGVAVMVAVAIMTTDFDRLLDEPDPRYCLLHDAFFPCLACLADLADREYDDKKGERS